MKRCSALGDEMTIHLAGPSAVLPITLAEVKRGDAGAAEVHHPLLQGLCT